MFLLLDLLGSLSCCDIGGGVLRCPWPRAAGVMFVPVTGDGSVGYGGCGRPRGWGWSGLRLGGRLDLSIAVALSAAVARFADWEFPVPGRRPSGIGSEGWFAAWKTVTAENVITLFLVAGRAPLLDLSPGFLAATISQVEVG